MDLVITRVRETVQKFTKFPAERFHLCILVNGVSFYTRIEYGKSYPLTRANFPVKQTLLLEMNLATNTWRAYYA
jgi:hypothetical protein